MGLLRETDRRINFEFWGKRGRMAIERLNNKDADVVWVFGLRSEKKVYFIKLRKPIRETEHWIREDSLKNLK